MNNNRKAFIPALRFHQLTALYDPMAKWILGEKVFKSQLINQARIDNGHKVLDLGCGTGTLAIMIKQTCPHSEVIGIDCDSNILKIAEAKVAKAGIIIPLNQGNSYDLPYASRMFDRVISSLMFHHLSTFDKLQTLQAVYRVLRPGGELHIADWGKAQNKFMRVAFYSVQMLDGFRTTSDNVKGLLPLLMKDSDYIEVQETTVYPTIFGTLSLYKGKKPE